MQKAVHLLTITLPHHVIDWLANRSLPQLILVILAYVGIVYFAPSIVGNVITATFLTLFLCYLLNLFYVAYQVHRRNN